MSCPIKVSTDPAAARRRLAKSRVVALDTETTGIDHRTARLVGLSAHVPGDDVGFYLPVYSEVEPADTLVRQEVVVGIVRSILATPERLVVMHNARFDLMVFRKLGIVCQCDLFDTMLAAHRLDNTYHSILRGADRLNYKLKTLTKYLLGKDQQTFEATTGGLPAQMVPISDMAPYAVSDAYYTARHYLRFHRFLDTERGVKRILEALDFPLLPMICEMLFRGIPVDLGAAQGGMKQAQARFEELNQQIIDLLGRPVNISKQGVLKRVLIEDCDLAEARWRRSLSEASLQQLAHGARGPRADFARNFVDLVLQRRKQAHLISSFYVPLIRRTDRKTGILHPGGFDSFNETGRFSARDPNVLALPKRGPIRGIITAGPGEMIVAIDFRNIEPRCLAQALLWFVRDRGEAVGAAKQRNWERAEAWFGDLLRQRVFTREYEEPEALRHPEESALASCFLSEDAAGPADPYAFAARRMFGVDAVDKEMRGRAKKIFLATIYGRGLPSLAADLKITIDEAADLMNKFAGAMPEIGCPTYRRAGPGCWVRIPATIATYRDEVEQLVRLTGEVESLFGRRRRFPGLYHLCCSRRIKVIYESGHRRLEWDVVPIQRWNYALHCYVYAVRDLRTDRVIATGGTPRDLQSLVNPHGLCRWPFRQLSYKRIRSVVCDDGVVHFEPLDHCHRQAFNAIIQMTAGDVFKRAMLAVGPVMQRHDARMILNVHDELVFTVPDGNLRQFVGEAVAVMEEAPASWFKIPIEVDVEVGRNYGDLKEYIPGRTNRRESPSRAHARVTKSRRARRQASSG